MAGAPSATAPASSGGTQTQQAPTAAAQQTPQVQSVVPFLRGSGKGKYKFFSKAGLTLTGATQDLGPIDIKAYDYMRSILVTLTTTAAGTAGTGDVYSIDAPFNAFTNVSVVQPNGQTMYQVSSGMHAALIQKYGYYRSESDPRADSEYALDAGGTAAPSFTFAFRIPFELDLRDALGALPNKDAAAPFQLLLTLNTLANVLTAGSGTTPTFTVEAWLEAYDQPPTVLDGQPVQTTPPNMNTLQRWTEQNITMNSGQFDARVRKLGNYVRMLLPVMKNSSNVRIITNGWADPVQIVLDEDVKDNISQADWRRRIWEIWGYGPAGSTIDSFTSGMSGRDTGVWPIPYFLDGRSPDENANLYLPTIESEDYLLRGSWGSAVSKMVVLVNEVLPQGNIFG